MIGYPISLADLKDKIRAEDSDWLDDADLRTEAFRSAGKYDEKLPLQKNGTPIGSKATSIWSRIKVVYIRLQNEKCAYCERKLESEEYGKGEHDLEHYRPKKQTKPWQPPAYLVKLGVTPTQPIHGNEDPGYHLLAYHPFNYCTSCNTCNRALKKNDFPIENGRDTNGDDPNLLLQREQPLLIYPIGDFDEDPTNLIHFNGVIPSPVKNFSGDRKRRALTTIEFFKLADFRRKNLHLERANEITQIYSYLEHSVTPGDDWDLLVQHLTSPKHRHTNCNRSFVSLYKQDKQKAVEIFKAALKFKHSCSQ